MYKLMHTERFSNQTLQQFIISKARPKNFRSYRVYLKEMKNCKLKAFGIFKNVPDSLSSICNYNVSGLQNVCRN